MRQRETARSLKSSRSSGLPVHVRVLLIEAVLIISLLALVAAITIPSLRRSNLSRDAVNLVMRATIPAIANAPMR